MRARAGRAVPVALLVLAVLTGLVYGPVGGHDFVNYDDAEYVYENPRVLAGLTLDGVRWAFTESHAANWHPLTWLSHMADVELFGAAPGRHHLVNVVLHVLNALLCFAFLRAATGAAWPSTLVAALFALHPLRVESVAWISERKDLLAGTFFFLTLLAYARYARAPSTGRYLLVALALALGLMAKPMLVTLPCVLLLLDLWPLRRPGRTGAAADAAAVGGARAREAAALRARSRLVAGDDGGPRRKPRPTSASRCAWPTR